ncbi:peptidylprolyl isomerase [Aurantibacter sp.]|uniref:peptidylprolyl isomerase n=1 Tax=Aurantibacter sp. TaxID=2807103 RepID=UPI0035C7FCA6
MAILNKIRQKTFVLILVIALALFAFILSGLVDNKDALFGKDQNIVASINGKDIGRTEFMQKVEFQQRQMGPNATTTQVMNQVFETEVRQAVMAAEFDKLGLSVESDQMRDVLRTALATSPEFLNEAGLFDDAKLTEYIANIKETSQEQYKQWINYEQNVASSALQTNYFNLVKAGTTATLAEGALEHKLEGDKVNISYVQVPFTSIVDSTVTVTKEEIKSYITKNSKEFETEASTDLQYVMFEEVASLEDENKIKSDLSALVEDKQEFDEATNKTEKVLGLKNTTDIEAFVNQNSDDFKYNSSFVTKAQLPAVVADTLANSPVGSVYGPYKDATYFKLSKIVATTKLPDSVKARHILIPFKGASSAGEDVVKTEEEARVFADSLTTILKSNTSKFEEFVTAYSSDKGSVEKGGFYDWYPYNQMVPEFRDFTFEGKTGDLDVVKTVFGFHIIEVQGQKGESNLYKVATIARKIEASEATSDQVFRDASNFEVNIASGSFADVSREANYDVKPVKTVKALDESIPGLGAQRAIVRWSFDSKTSVGDIKRYTVPGGYAVVQVTAKRDAGLMTVEEASATVTPKLRAEKKAKMIMDGVSASTLEDFAAEKGQQVKTASAINMKNPTIGGAGKEPLVVGYAFGLKDNETSKLIIGEKGVYMVKRTGFTPAVKLDNYQSFANQVSTQKLNAVQGKLYTALKEAADVVDNRAKTVQ